MIKANELRIGNYIKFHNHLEKEKIVSINARFFSSLAGGRSLEDIKPDEVLSNYYQPIPITPEILEKCGFVKQYDECVFDFGNSRIEQVIWADSEPEWKFRRILGNDLTSWRHGMIAINYLHQLQNLYYSLKNEELEFKP